MYQVYKVMDDDTFEALATRLGISSSELERINGFNAFNVGDMIVVPNNSMYFTYVVKKGDNLYTIAQNYNQDVKTLYNINGIKEGDYIYPGEEILIPRKDIITYFTKQGDTIKSISNMTSMKVEELMNENDFVLEPGQLIMYERVD